MKIGILQENLQNEKRVAIIPITAEILVKAGHEVFITSDAGTKSGYSNDDYTNKGVTVLNTNLETLQICELLLKIGDLIEEEIYHLKPNTIFLSFLNLINKPNYAKKLASKEITAIALEEIKNKNNEKIILSSMSKIAGKLSVILAGNILSNDKWGKGNLLGGTPTSTRSKVVIIGAGVAGEEAAKICTELGCRVKIFDTKAEKLNHISSKYPNIEAFYPYPDYIRKNIADADLVIGSIFLPKRKNNPLIPDNFISDMGKGSVVIDLSIERGGIFENIRETTCKKPYYQKRGIIFCAIPNLNSLVPKTSSEALSSSLLPYVLGVSNENGIFSESIKNAVQIYHGKIEDYIDFNDIHEHEVSEDIPLFNIEDRKDQDYINQVNSLIEEYNNQD